jgi:hypothetical protein
VHARVVRPARRDRSHTAIGRCIVHDDDFDRTLTKAHIAWEVRGLETWREKLKSRGIKSLEGIPIPGFNRFEFRDPFGNRVEFIEKET